MYLPAYSDFNKRFCKNCNSDKEIYSRHYDASVFFNAVSYRTAVCKFPRSGAPECCEQKEDNACCDIRPFIRTGEQRYIHSEIVSAVGDGDCRRAEQSVSKRYCIV